MKKYTLSLLVALFGLVSLATAQTTAPAITAVEPAAKTEASVALGYEGQYVFRGQKISDNVATGTVTVTLPSQTELSVTAYQNTSKKDVSVNDEFDVTLSQGFSLDKVTTLTVGGTGYFYPRANVATGETSYTLEAFTSIGYDAFLSPTATVAYDFYLKQTSVEGSLSQDVKIPFLSSNWKLVPAVAVGWANANDLYPSFKGSPIKDSYYYGTGKIDLVYEAKHFVTAVGYRYNYLDNSAVSHNGWFGGSVSLRF